MAGYGRGADRRIGGHSIDVERNVRQPRAPAMRLDHHRSVTINPVCTKSGALQTYALHTIVPGDLVGQPPLSPTWQQTSNSLRPPLTVELAVALGFG